MKNQTIKNKTTLKSFFMILFILLVSKSDAQNNCPSGYSEKNVKCAGKISVQCVPNDYNCNFCWGIKWPPCAGHTLGGGDFKNSYESALEEGEREKNKEHDDCPLWNNREYTIYLDDGKFCNLNSLTVKEDYKSKLLSLYDTWGQCMISMADAIEKYRGYTGPGIPELTQVTTEFLGNIQEGARKLKKLKEFNDDYVYKKISEIEEQFNNFQNEYNEVQRFSNDFNSKIQTVISTNPSWKILPNGSFYKILPDGKYLLFDKNKIKTVSAAEGITIVNKTNGTKPHKELTDDEKLNQALMKQLEKDFDNRNKPSTTVPEKTNNLDHNNSSNKTYNQKNNTNLNKPPTNLKAESSYAGPKWAFGLAQGWKSMFGYSIISDLVDMSTLHCTGFKMNEGAEMNYYYCLRNWFENKLKSNLQEGEWSINTTYSKPDNIFFCEKKECFFFNKEDAIEAREKIIAREKMLGKIKLIH